ncbi:AfsR/SARP family transcriptional regulator [Actinoplanes regularis]|uniref:AfsR/SARP family transcriptional regulator n=1 Tax=Actinoplanes regularis TaxID=52697 RepID=UPI0024A3BB15|nr:BTAD domain-containing putative transcriptional regulator [Actinoplanes regularis]GLW33814.1 hypothetical protein Areg01_67520 [Actinoplanes regularis]
MTDGNSAVAPRFEILGPLRAYRDARPVDLGPPKQQGLLALLLLHAGEPVPMERIIDALWSGDPPENAVDVVQRCVGALRRALDPDRTSLLTLTPGGYLLRAGDSAVDAELFRAALARARDAHRTGDLNGATDEVRQALGLWQDEPLAGLTGPVFESARARLNEERATASNLLATPTRTGTATPVPAPRATAGPVPAPQATARPIPAQTAAAEPVPAEPIAPDPAYPEPVDPWAGHQLFPHSPI